MDQSQRLEEATNSKIVGPGVWTILHMVALDADEDPDILPHLLYLINKIANDFKPQECRNHFAEYIKTHPLVSGSAFSWTVGAHNEVNKRNNKPIVSERDARDIWGPTNVSIKPCSGENSHSHAQSSYASNASYNYPQQKTASGNPATMPPSTGPTVNYQFNGFGPGALMHPLGGLWDAIRR